MGRGSNGTQEGMQVQQATLQQIDGNNDNGKVPAPDYEKAIAERDERIVSLEAQVAEAAKNAVRQGTNLLVKRTYRPKRGLAVARNDTETLYEKTCITNGLEHSSEEARTINWTVDHPALYANIVFAQHKGILYLIVW